MIDTYIANFVRGRDQLWRVVNLVTRKKNESPNSQVPESVRLVIEGNIQEAVKACVAALKLEAASDTTIYLENLFNSHEFHRYTWGELHALLDRLWTDIGVGIGGEYFFHYAPEAARDCLFIDRDWEGILAAFPSARKEIEATLDCLAHEDLPGVVFHMVRISELGLRTIAKERGLTHVANGRKPLDYGTWKDVFEAIEKKLTSIRSASAGPKRDAATSFYDVALSDLRTMQGFRDPVMHFREQFDPGQADSAIFRTKELMAKLATKLSEQSTTEIDWGI